MTKMTRPNSNLYNLYFSTSSVKNKQYIVLIYMKEYVSIVGRWILILYLQSGVSRRINEALSKQKFFVHKDDKRYGENYDNKQQQITVCSFGLTLC